MKVCNGCGVNYEQHEIYCHKCDKELTGDNIRTKLSRNDEVILFKARKIVSNVHGSLASLLGLIMAYMTYNALVGKSSFDQSTINIFIVMSLFFLLHIVAATGIHKKKNYGRNLSLLLGVILLMPFPLVTPIGATLLYQLNKKQWSYE